MESDEEQRVKTEIIHSEKPLNHCTFDNCEYNSYEKGNLRRHINTVHEKKKNIFLKILILWLCPHLMSLKKILLKVLG